MLLRFLKTVLGRPRGLGQGGPDDGAAQLRQAHGRIIRTRRQTGRAEFCPRWPLEVLHSAEPLRGGGGFLTTAKVRGRGLTAASTCDCKSDSQRNGWWHLAQPRKQRHAEPFFFFLSFHNLMFLLKTTQRTVGVGAGGREGGLFPLLSDKFKVCMKLNKTMNVSVESCDTHTLKKKKQNFLCVSVQTMLLNQVPWL